MTEASLALRNDSTRAPGCVDQVHGLARGFHSVLSGIMRGKHDEIVIAGQGKLPHLRVQERG